MAGQVGGEYFLNSHRVRLARSSFPSRRWDQANGVQLLHLLPDVVLSERHVDHRRLDVGVSHRLHEGDGIRAGHGHLRAEGVPKPMDANVGDARAFFRHRSDFPGRHLTGLCAMGRPASFLTFRFPALSLAICNAPIASSQSGFVRTELVVLGLHASFGLTWSRRFSKSTSSHSRWRSSSFRIPENIRS